MVQPTTAKFSKMRIMLGTETGVDPAPVTVTSLSKANPAVCTVGVSDITKFQNGMQVLIAGAVGTGLVNANGLKTIGSVGVPANTFQLLGTDTSAAAAAQTTGVTADPPKLVTYSAPCGLDTKTVALSKNLNEVSIPDCTDEDAPTWMAREVANYSVTISGEGLAASESIQEWDNTFLQSTSRMMRCELEYTGIGFKRIEGKFHLDSETLSGELGNRVRIAINAQSDGPIAVSWSTT